MGPVARERMMSESNEKTDVEKMLRDRILTVAASTGQSDVAALQAISTAILALQALKKG